MASGWRYIAQVGHKILVAFLTMVLRIGDMKFQRPSGDQIANIMQLALLFLGFGPLRGEKAVANWDEDSITMAVAAAKDCLKGENKDQVDGL